MNIYDVLARHSGQPAPNVDPETGIHFGVIPQHDLAPEALEDVFQDGTDLGYEAAVEEAQATVRSAVEQVLGLEDQQQKILTLQAVDCIGEDNAEASLECFDGQDDPAQIAREIWDLVSDDFGMGFESDGPMLWEDGEYKLQADSDGDLWVLKSPYYTTCGMCSPCAPNAGYLITQPGTLKTYALGSDYFEDPAKLPYPLWSVATGQRVIPVKRFRLVNLRVFGEKRCTPIPDGFEVYHGDRESAGQYAASQGFAEWETWEEYNDMPFPEDAPEVAAWDKEREAD